MKLEEVFKNKKKIRKMESATKSFDALLDMHRRHIGILFSIIFVFSIFIIFFLAILERMHLNMASNGLLGAMIIFSTFLLYRCFSVYEEFLERKVLEKIKKKTNSFSNKQKQMGIMADINEENVDMLFDEIIALNEKNAKMPVPKEFINSVIDFKENLLDLELDNRINNVVEKTERLNEKKLMNKNMINS